MSLGMRSTDGFGPQGGAIASPVIPKSVILACVELEQVSGLCAIERLPPNLSFILPELPLTSLLAQDSDARETTKSQWSLRASDIGIASDVDIFLECSLADSLEVFLNLFSFLGSVDRHPLGLGNSEVLLDAFLWDPMGAVLVVTPLEPGSLEDPTGRRGTLVFVVLGAPLGIIAGSVVDTSSRLS